MLAFEISLNGKKLCVAGIGDHGVLVAGVDWVVKGEEGDLFLSVSGLVSPADEHVDWISQEQLKVDDEVRVRIVETTQPDEPAKRYRSKLPKSRHIGGVIGPY
jgi:hypothetical protein